jgi:hypothetical protein
MNAVPFRTLGRPLVARALFTLVAVTLLAMPRPLGAQAAPAGRAAVERALLTGRYDEVHSLAAPLGDDAAAAVLRARAYVAVGRYADAEKVLQPAVSENPISDAAVELGLVRRLQGRRVEALRTLSLIL